MSRDAVMALLPWHAPVIESLARTAAASRLGHALLLHGPPGVGKGRLANALAEALIRGLPPADWPTAIATDAGPEALDDPLPEIADLHRLEPPEERRTIGVDQVRGMIDTMSLTSHGGGARAVVLQPAEQMTINAANSLLKTLEEPPPDAYLLLVSHQPGRLPATVRSRCQRLAVPRPTSGQALAWLQRGGGEVDWPLALALCGGSPLTAWRAGREGIVGSDRSRCVQLAEVLEGRGDPLAVADDWLGQRDAAPEVLRWLQQRLESVLRDLCRADPHAPHDDYARLLRAGAALGVPRLFALRDEVGRLRRLADGGVNLALGLEAALLGAVSAARC